MRKWIILFGGALVAVLATAQWFKTQKTTPAPTAAANHILLDGLSDRQRRLLNQPALDRTVVINRLIVEKSKREMHAYHDNKKLKSYPISLGFNPVGHKQFEGDGKTPEGIYTINDRNPNSSYYKNLGISYPNDQDTAYAKSQGRLAGGLIKIHGVKNGLYEVVGDRHLLNDWTHGCIAVSNGHMEQLFNLVADNATIDIRP